MKNRYTEQALNSKSLDFLLSNQMISFVQWGKMPGCSCHARTGKGLGLDPTSILVLLYIFKPDL